MNRNSAVDITKYVAAIFVVAIHTHPLRDMGELADFISVGLLSRWAVPFFAICTGFYLALASSHNNIWLVMKNTFFKILKMYVGWSLLFLLIHLIDWYRAGTLCHEYILGWFMSFLVGEPFYHLWYLSALLYAIPLFALILRFIPLKYFHVISLCLWSIQVISYAYANNLPESIRGFVLSTTAIPSLYTGVTRLLPLMLIGAWLSRYDLKNSIVKSSALFLFFFMLMIAEALCIKSLGGERWSFIFSTLPMAAALFCVIYDLGGKIKSSYLYAKISMIIYCIHPAVIWLFKEVISNHLLLFIIVSIVSTFISLMWLHIRIIKTE